MTCLAHDGRSARLKAGHTVGESQEELGQWDLILTRCAALPGDLPGDKGVLSTGRDLG